MKPKNHKERIKSHMSAMEMVMALGDGNPGGIRVCVQLINSSDDADNAFGGFGHILSLDSHGIYGPNIWVFFNICCRNSVLGAITVLRACQLGLISETELWSTLDNKGTFDLATLYTRVKSQLKNFNPTNAHEQWMSKEGELK